LIIFPNGKVFNLIINFFQKLILNWKEKYLNFVIEYHFSDHSLEKKIKHMIYEWRKTLWII
jgi:hypothetical protein